MLTEVSEKAGVVLAVIGYGLSWVPIVRDGKY